jgi:hypothetical protein
MKKMWQLHITADEREIKDFPKFACRLLFARRYKPLQKYASYLYKRIYLKVRREKMREKLQLKGGISEQGSDIPLNWRDMRSGTI